MGVKEIESLKDFHDIINSGKPVVVYFWATWCGPCVQISPAFEKLSGDPENAEVECYKVNVDKAGVVALQVGIKAMPSFISYKDGNKRREVLGAHYSHIKDLLQDTAKLA